jgi:hypothetical protein
MRNHCGKKLYSYTVYRRASREAKFWKNVALSGSCMIWGASTKVGSGYGQFRWEGKLVSAHRLAWFFVFGRWPADGKFICHLCNNRKCVKPSHLYEGNARSNALDWWEAKDSSRMCERTFASSAK